MMKVMIIEDDLVIASSLQEELMRWQYEAFHVTDFNDVMNTFAQEAPQLVLIDIKLPYFNGYYWCTEIRKISQVPIIFVSSQSDRMDIVMAIQMGADDFISKPFDLTVALAKIQALLRRTYDFTGNDVYLSYQQVYLKTNELKVQYQDQEVELTKNEIKILEVLFLQKGAYVSREAIMMKLWENDSFIDDNTLAVNINRLRKKLAEINVTSFIVTKKGYGYGLQKDDHDEID
ncbi:response regulator transcription factor [Trichococcus shcherbakoviae subsp. psychrophilus]|uniref:Response regulator transcription factor n=2 Tax=Trichococcus shcherbakoviae TaxID=2094020 RepID=A0A5C5E4P1_9LACT|nr:response regulator transcription factor [Trichococcus shcherbakoviae]TNV68166.1 response regulator transcription factor [Trichococcus shcherbakoviae subsp. psychrophilus]